MLYVSFSCGMKSINSALAFIAVWAENSVCEESMGWAQTAFYIPMEKVHASREVFGVFLRISKQAFTEAMYFVHKPRKIIFALVWAGFMFHVSQGHLLMFWRSQNTLWPGNPFEAALFLMECVVGRWPLGNVARGSGVEGRKCAENHISGFCLYTTWWTRFPAIFDIVEGYTLPEEKKNAFSAHNSMLVPTSIPERMWNVLRATQKCL